MGEQRRKQERRFKMGNDDKGSPLPSASKPQEEGDYSSLKGKVVLTLKMDQFGNVALYAPSVPPKQTCTLLAQVIINLIFETLGEKSRILTPFGIGG